MMSKKRLSLTLGIIGIIIAGLLLAAGCTGTDEGSSSGSGSGVVSFEDLTSLTKLAPAGATMAYADMKTLMEDTDLSEMYENMEGELDDASALGIAPSSVKHFGMIMVDNEPIAVVIGADLDLDVIHAKLAEEDSESEDYLGFEVWRDGNDLTLVILDDALLMGPEDGIKACLDAIDSGATAYASNQHIRDVLGRMSDGLMTMIMPGEQFYPGSLYVGITIEKISTTSMKMRGLMKFGSESDAADAEAEMKAGLEMTDEIEMSVSRSGQFVEFATEMDIGAGSFFG